MALDWPWPRCVSAYWPLVIGRRKDNFEVIRHNGEIGWSVPM